MARVPGAVGLQQFGIGLFVKAGDAGQVTTPPYGGTAEGENVTRLERVVYDQTSTPVFISAAVTAPGTLASNCGETDAIASRVVYDQTSTPIYLRGAQQPYPAYILEIAANVVRRAVVGSLAAVAASSAMAEPVFVPSQVTTAAIAPVEAVWQRQKVKPVPRSAFVFRQFSNLWDSNVSDLGGIRPKRKILPDAIIEPPRVVLAVTPTPSEFAYQPVEAVWRVQKKLLPDGFTSQFRILAATPSEFAYQPVEAVWRVQRKILPDGFTPQFRILASTPDVFGYQTVDVTWRQQRKVLPDGIAVVLTSPAAATPIAPSDAVARARRINLPDGYAAPVSPPVAAPAAIFTGALGNSLTVVRTACIVGGQTSTPVFPPTVTGTPVELRWVPNNSLTIVRTVCTVLDQTSTPGFPPTPPPGTPVELRFVPDAPQPGFYRPKIKPVQLSAFVFAYPVDDTVAAIASGYSSATVVTSRVVYDQTAARPVFPPAAPPITPVELRFVPDAPQNWFRRSKIKPVQQSAFVFVYSVDDAVGGIGCAYSSATVVTSRVVYDQGAARPVFPPTTVVAPPPTFYQADEGAPQRRLSRPGIKLDLEGFERPTTQQQTLFWFETYPAVRAAPISARAVKGNLDGFDRPLIQITVTPSFLFETIAPPWKATPNAKAIRTDLDGFRKPDALPAPPTATPAILFDVIPPVQRMLPNGKAIGINLQGFAWNPQDPRNLHGVIFVPPTSLYPTGGESYWHVTQKAKKSDKRCRFVTIDGVLTWICDRLDYERAAEARLQALDLVYDAEGELEPLYEALRVEEATNASAAKRAAAALLMHAIHEAVLEEEDDDLLLLD